MEAVSRAALPGPRLPAVAGRVAAVSSLALVAALTAALPATAEPSAASGTVAGATGGMVAGATGGTVAGASDGTTQVLLDQAAFWRGKGRRDLALEALQRVYAAAPDDAEVLYRLGLYALEDGDAASAQGWLARLRRVAPGDARADRLDGALRQGAISPAGIEEARALAQAGQADAAVARYRQIFGAALPPDGYALEYYLALAGTVAGFDEATRGLAALAAQDPAGAAAAAQARVLTYREDTRRQGITLLARRAALDPADGALLRDWRQALLWLGPTPADKPLYDAYLALVPGDADVRARYDAATRPQIVAAPAMPAVTPAPAALPVAATQPGVAEAVARGEQLRQAGRYAEAYDVLALALGGAPDDAELLAALAKLYSAGGMHAEALRLHAALLSRAPADDQRVEDAVGAAVAAGDFATAQAWLGGAMARSPDDPRLHLVAARLAEARGDRAGAVAALETARRLRARQLGTATAEVAPVPRDPVAQGVPGNPFRTAPATPPRTVASVADVPRSAPPRRPPAVTAQAAAPAPSLKPAPIPAPIPAPVASTMPRPLAFAESTAAAGQTSGGLYLPGGRVDAPAATSTAPRSLIPPTAQPALTGSADMPAAPAGGTAPAATGGYARPAAPVSYPPLTTAQASEGIGLPAPALINDPMSQDIARELAELRQNTVPYVRGEVGLRNREGEAGLSELTEVHADISASISPFDEGRLTVSIQPVSIEAGTPADDGARRFGLNALVPTTVTEDNHDELATIVDNNSNVWNLLTPTEKQILGAAVTTPEKTLLSDFFTTNSALVSALSDTLQTALTTALATDGALLSDFVTDNEAILTTAGGLSTTQRALITTALASEVYSFDSARLAALRRTPTQEDKGAALALAYEIGDIKADVGSTPQGFEVSNVVGGVTYAPKLDANTTLKLTGERRAVTDSLLSYAGTIEPFTGKRWGGVTRTGGRVMLANDDGKVGVYGGGGYYTLEGENVADNTQMEATVGAYVRAYKTDTAEVKVGLNLSYLDYDKNLGEFSFGHGGYFSPQNFYSIAIPVDYTGESRNGKWKYGVGGAVGYQNYDKDAAPYFPTDKALQNILDQEVDAGLITTSTYAAASNSGIGGNVHGNFDYSIDRLTTVGGAASYDSFGDFSETNVMFYVKRMLEFEP